MWLIVWLGAALAAPLMPDDAVQAGLARSPEVARAEAAVRAATGEVRAASGLRLNPSVSLNSGIVGESRLEGAVVQPLSLTGEGLADRRSAVAAREAAEARLARTRLEVAATTRAAWVDAVSVVRSAELAEAALALATRLRVGAEARLASGDASLLDVRLARLAETEAAAGWVEATAAEAEALAELAARVGLTVDGIELPDDPLLAAPEQVSEGERQDVAAARAEVDSAGAALARERAAILPPVGLGVSYEGEGGSSALGPALRLTLPLWQHNADGRSEAAGELMAARAALAVLEDRADAEQAALDTALQRLAAVADAVDPGRLEDARAALESVAVGYEAGELDLLESTLLRSQITEGQQAWYLARRALARARIARALALGDRRLVGGALPVDGGGR